MNLLRVMPAEGSGLLGFISAMTGSRFPEPGKAAFFMVVHLSVKKGMEIEIRINGREQRLKACSIAELVAARDLAAGSLIVEHNGRIVRQEDWARVMLGQGDVLEMLNFVGGG